MLKRLLYSAFLMGCSCACFAQDSLAKIYFFRETSFVKPPVVYDIYFDTILIGKMSPGAILSYRCSPGLTRFWAKIEGERSFLITLTPGETYFVNCGIEQGIPVMPVFREVLRSKALAALRKINRYTAAEISIGLTELSPAQQRDTVRALVNLFRRKHNGGVARCVIFGLGGILTLINGDASNSTAVPAGVLFLSISVSGAGQAAQFNNSKLDRVLQEVKAGRRLSQKIKYKLKEKDFKKGLSKFPVRTTIG